MSPTTPQEACFEAGVKFGTLYHQFAGTPVSPASADSLERAMEEAIENQPFCESVSVDILREALEAELSSQSADYTELTGRFMEVEIVVEYDGCEVVTAMSMDGDYPKMRVERVRS
ncbi:MAG: dihydroneopterin aldolase family protein [Natronomonas sp.]